MSESEVRGTATRSAEDLDSVQACLARAKEALVMAQAASDPETAAAISRISAAWLDIATQAAGRVTAELFSGAASNDSEGV